MLLDVGVSLSVVGQVTLFTRRDLVAGSADPKCAWVPIGVASAKRSYVLRRAAVRVAGATNTPESPWAGAIPLEPPPARIGSTKSVGLGPYYAFVCLPLTLEGADLSRRSGLRVVIEAEVKRPDGRVISLVTTSALHHSALPAPKGWHPGDAHVHSTASDGKLDVLETARCLAGFSGLSWMVLTDHADKVTDWQAYADQCAKATSSGALVCAGAELATGRGMNEGHVLGLGMPTGAGSKLPAVTTPPQKVVCSVARLGGSSFAAIAHPHHWLYDWPDWNVKGFRALEIATGGNRTVSNAARKSWFRLLRQDLSRWKDGVHAPEFVVGLATTDSHSVPLSVMPGERHLTWVSAGEKPRNADALFSRLRAGHCVASCGGDFGSFSIHDAGPGSACAIGRRSYALADFEIRPRHGHDLEQVRLYDRDGRMLTLRPPFRQPTFRLQLKLRHTRSFYLAEFLFTDEDGRRWAVWTNPVWVVVK
jgi:hypothetical protein